jgi:hypothetical protein
MRVIDDLLPRTPSLTWNNAGHYADSRTITTSCPGTFPAVISATFEGAKRRALLLATGASWNFRFRWVQMQWQRRSEPKAGIAREPPSVTSGIASGAYERSLSMKLIARMPLRLSADKLSNCAQGPVKVRKVLANPTRVGAFCNEVELSPLSEPSLYLNINATPSLVRSNKRQVLLLLLAPDLPQR